MATLHFEIVFEKLAEATSADGDGATSEDYRGILSEVDEVAELKRLALDMADPGEQSYTTT
jgi:hypothetical protein